ncbi:hypothetical protein T03_6521 [Trichinella britovi]|uniref:Uncharacterized protein n=1 Tax=Trichinella britovi TaxID=45882 RepID=A0A0V1D0M5_TRIBR|nr:hypothetical protein T03_6521 [Trichinella britovi]
MRSLISPFISKLAMFKRNLGGREFYQFPSVAALRENGEVHDDDIQIYCDHLDMLQKDMQERFQDILKMKILNWVIDLFSNSNEIEMELKEELIDLQTNEELKPKQMQLLGRSASDTESLMAVRSCLRLILTKTCDLALPLKINETRLNTVCSWFENIN